MLYMVTKNNIEIPQIVLDAYGISADTHAAHPLAGGQVNSTLLIEANDSDDKFILRKLSPILGTHTVADTCVIANHLADKGWEAPVEHPTLDKDIAVRAGEEIWHAEVHITSYPSGPAPVNEQTARNVGLLLGKWHQDIADLDYIPTGIPHFHDTNYIAQELTRNISRLDAVAQASGRILLSNYATVDIPDNTGNQIIHGDPKLDNMLFRNGVPFTLIDLDCAMRDSVWTDIGDALRSLLAKHKEADLPTEYVVDNFAEGYLDSNGIKVSSSMFMHFCLQSAKRITTELGMRYLNDIVDGNNYFGWDKNNFETRADALYIKSQTQLQVISELNSKLNIDEEVV